MTNHLHQSSCQERNEDGVGHAANALGHGCEPPLETKTTRGHAHYARKDVAHEQHEGHVESHDSSDDDEQIRQDFQELYGRNLRDGSTGVA